MTLSSKKDVVIVGGGISGLIAANILENKGIKTTILDKGRGIGGRLATRRIPHSEDITGVFDYGMQLFTVTDARVQQLVDQWLAEDVITKWSNEYGDRKIPCYRGCESNRSLGKYLAKDLDVNLQTRAISVQNSDSGWTVKTESGQDFQGNILIMTCPVPQSLTLLKNSGFLLPSSIQSRLEGVSYYPCITILGLLEKLSLIPNSGWLTLNNYSVATIACNHKKGISPQGFAVTIHSTPEFSWDHWDTDDEIIVEKLLDSTSNWLGSKVIDYQVHRWRYSQPKTVYGEPFLALENPNSLILAGDAFSETPALNRYLTLEKAVLSGIKSAQYLENKM
ncbi:NAD(P)/FAD-dependent oxidoreductase [Crocosphaera sp. Alani8]|uniref:NAD(P)/FAD-dependent oxidoreductase n=1 Tax=Crocosphaera sp. Alani8 TaxID=3038952 RepID=UPI00313E39C2